VGVGVGVALGIGVGVGVDVGVGVGVGLGGTPPNAAFKASKSTPMSLPSVAAFLYGLVVSNLYALSTTTSPRVAG
jgi:hypothetical protein